MKHILVIAAAYLLCGCSAKNNPELRPMRHFGEARTDGLPNRFTLLNWNVYKGRRANFMEEFKRLSAKADIITLQEASTSEKGGMQNFEPLSPPGMAFQMSGVLMYADGHAGAATGSTARPQKVIAMPSTNSEPFVSLRKSSIITRYRIEGSSKTLIVANTHGLNLSGKLWFSQKAFDRQVREIADVLVRHDGPLIWTGDFNTHDASKTAALQRQTQRLGLSRLPVQDSDRLMHSKVADLEIDHVYVRGMKASAEAPEHHSSSDHAPILVKVFLP